MSFDLELCYLVGAGLGWRLANDDWDAGRQRERREELLAELAAWGRPSGVNAGRASKANSSSSGRPREPPVSDHCHDRGPRWRQADGDAGGPFRRLRTGAGRGAARSLFTIRAVPKQKVVL